MNVRYFFIADRVKAKEVRIEYCPTGLMVADYFTKPLQGVIFRKLRAMIMGTTDIALPTNTTDPTKGIPAVLPLQESRSVLKSELPRSNVLPARVPTSKGMTSPLTVLPTSLRTSNNVVARASKQVSKLALSWAQVASR
jgi:hypothetical protein